MSSEASRAVHQLKESGGVSQPEKRSVSGRAPPGSIPLERCMIDDKLPMEPNEIVEGSEAKRSLTSKLG